MRSAEGCHRSSALIGADDRGIWFHQSRMAGKLIGGIVALALLPATAWGAGSAASLPTVPSGARPGPDILYAPPPRAPPLENAGVWKATPILIPGAPAY